MAEKAIGIRSVDSHDRSRLKDVIRNCWGSERVVVHDKEYSPADLDGLIAYDDEAWLGVITYNIEGDQCEIVTLNSFYPSRGIGTALIKELRRLVSQRGCTRIWLVTTNDNVDALRFYQKHGFAIVRIDIGAVERARKIKPEIPFIGQNRIPMRDEIELDLRL
ncbi:MAG: GNAT family N-acetyltransferase [bacterium]